MEIVEAGIKATAYEWYSGFKRHLRAIMLTAVVIFSLAATYIQRIPNVYHAETRILVNPQRVSDKYVSSAVSMGANERLNTLSQQVLSTSRLEVIFNDFNLFAPLREKVSHQALIERMRHNIGIELKQSSEGPSSFTLSYNGDSPVEVAAVTNRLADSFIAWNLHDRAQEAQGTTDFLSSELVESKSKLDALEQQLRVYKMEHLGELPDQLQANIQTLSRLEVQLQANVEARNHLDREATLASMEQHDLGYTPSPQLNTVSSWQRIQNQTEIARQELQELRKRYTDEHPDVVQKQQQLAVLEQELAQTPHTSASTQSARQSGAALGDPRAQMMTQERNRLLAAQKLIEMEINRKQATVDAEPIREQEISQLLRDYETARQHYSLLLEKSYSAQMASELERKQQGGSFTLLDVARVPDAPSGPKRVAFLIGAFLFSIAAGLGVAVLLENADDTVKSEAHLRRMLPGVPLLGLTPKVSGPQKPGKTAAPKTLAPRSENAPIYPNL